MAIATTQQITKYYDYYRDQEIIFSKEMLHTLRLDPRQIYVKCNGGQWPCIINSTSFQMAKIIVGTTGGAFAEMTKKDGPTVQLRYCFIEPDNTPLPFFVSGKVAGVTPYMNSQNLAVVTLMFTQRPPDDLILKLGSLIEANQNAIRRREERIVITPNTLRKLNIEKEEALVFIQNVPRRCILRDLSFGGAKVILLGITKFLVNKEAILQITFSDPVETLEIRGTVISAMPIEGRQDIAAVSINFDVSQTPMNYKIHINNYLSNTRKTFLDVSENPAAAAQQQAGAQQAAAGQPQAAQAAKAPAPQPASAAAPQAAAAKPAAPQAAPKPQTATAAPAAEQKETAKPETVANEDFATTSASDDYPPETDSEIVEESFDAPDIE